MQLWFVGSQNQAKIIIIISIVTIFCVAFCTSHTSVGTHVEHRRTHVESGCGDGKSDFFKDYEKCGVYYQCDEHDIPTAYKCTGDQSYDDSQQKCVNSPPCSANIKFPDNQNDWRCDRNYDKHGVGVKQCSEYYVCHWTGSYFSLEFRSCRIESTEFPGHFFGSYFSEFSMSCRPKNYLDGVCPQSLMLDPGGWCPSRGFKQSPETCTHYYKCFRGRFVLLSKCPRGEIYNNLANNPGCIPGSCPVPEEKPLPPNWKCLADGQDHLHPEDCTKYYKCYACKSSHPGGSQWCYEYFERCMYDEFFDEKLRKCVSIQFCPQDIRNLPDRDGWRCTRPAERVAHPDSCLDYITCIKCKRSPNGWCYVSTHCPTGQYFDNEHRECEAISGDTCTQPLKELPDGVGWNCAYEVEKNGVPDNCRDYYTCHACDKPRKWCYLRHECPTGQIYDGAKGTCVVGTTCKTGPRGLPDKWKCGNENELNVDPTNCHNFYKCLSCPLGHPWCYEPQECSPGEFFDDFNKACVVSTICPQERPELPSGPGWNCQKDKETNVHPTDCTQYYQCHRCTKPSGWCYEATKCGPGMFFDQSKRQCVASKICPQDWLELPSTPGWQCGVENEKNLVPQSCSSFYTCYQCDKPRKWCYIPEECPAGQKFDDAGKNCVVGTCQAHPPVLPEGWTCTSDNQLNVDPTNCHKFYKCIRCQHGHPWCYESKECPAGQYFDDFDKVCVASTICPQERPELPSGPGWNCQKDKETNVHPTDCSQYYTCHRCTKPSGWCYEATKCDPGMFFDQGKKQCVITRVCPQDWLELPSGPGWNCTVENEKNMVPDSCSSFYTCYQCDKPRKWCYIREECPAGQSFIQGSCVVGRCPSYPPILPPNWSCTKEGELNVEPTNCKKFYKCIRCPDNYPWCYESQECSVGQFFDDFNKACVVSTVCPQERPEVPSGPGWNCQKDKEKNVHPTDCTQFYTCFRCTKPSGWCYEATKCGPGMFFDQGKRECVQSNTCPQNMLELPSGPGWNCAVEGEKNVMPGNCSTFYTCHACDKPRKWCYIPQDCPSGQTFDNVQKSCVAGRCPSYPPILPPNWTCTNENQLNVDPTNCKKFYKCLRCPDNYPWCYEPLECSQSEFFDDFNKACVVSTVCPQERPELPSGPGWSCQKDKETNVHPTDCTQFYTCFRCTKPSGWCYEATKCGNGMFFDQSKRQCENGKTCPQDLLELPSLPGWNCAAEQEKHVIPKNCSNFYTCISCDKPRKWCYIPQECPPGQTFDDNKKSCAVGRCPSDPPILPPNYTCENDYELNVEPTDCKKYYKCMRCPDNRNVWCYEIKDCPDDAFFDQKERTCVAHPHCPQEHTELPSGPGWSCKSESETNVLPTDCTQYYTCHRCSKPSGWCYETTKCGQGMFFDQGKRQCVASKVCPQDLLELPSTPGWNCAVEEEKHVVPDNCSNFYTCYSCDKPRKWCYIPQECPSGQTFDDNKKSCVVGRCPSLPPPLPPIYTCANDNELNVEPTKCKKYYKCIRCPDSSNGWCYELKDCPDGQYFDQKQTTCIAHEHCPQDHTELPSGPGWSCKSESETNVLPTDCTQYYTCHRCSMPSGWCYEATKCGQGMFFDQQQKKCTTAKTCPQDMLELPSGPGWECAFENDKNVIPNNCSNFYTCHKCDKPRKWCYIPQECPPGETYDNIEKHCAPGRCPNYPPILPQNWTCSSVNQLNVDPGNCQQFYKCVKCPDNYPWCYEMQFCPEGIYFNDFNKSCVASKTCPQDLTELPSGPGWSCGKDQETNVHPEDCSQYYKCIRCSKPSGWCYEAVKCDPGMYFDQGKKRCVATETCPQLWKELPSGPGWKCTSEREKNIVPGNCSTYYNCHQCDKPRKWCYSEVQCASGEIFDNIAKTCVVGRCPWYPPIAGRNLTCENENQLVGDLKDCKKYSKCIRCPDNYPWCYETHECSDGEYFDHFHKACVVSPICPQERPELPPGPGWNCTKDKETNVLGSDCHQFYTCFRCTKPRGWCYKVDTCANGMYFEQETRQCAKTTFCPQDKVELPSGPGWSCAAEHEKKVVPDDCTDYYTCHSCDKPRKWCYVRYDCPPGQVFDIKKLTCVVGRCLVLGNWTCERENQLHVDPTNCKKYINCIPCPDNPKSWCYEPKQCAEGTYFDDFNKACVLSNFCPQKYPELPLGVGWYCKAEKELNVHPKDCSQYYKCIPCTKPRGWCYEAVKCDPKMFFDQGKKRCVATEICPQRLRELPSSPGWHCEAEGDKNNVPGNCATYYTCAACDKPRKWCYTARHCPPGETFDEELDRCHRTRCKYWPQILPPDWTCSLNEKRVDPLDCTKCCKCVKCPDKHPWCCQALETCPARQWFDDVLKVCVKGNYCPQDLIEIGNGAGWACSREGETSVLPSDCSKFYTCLSCSKPRKWCYAMEESCLSGSNFDQFHRKCIAGICPQDRAEIWDGAKCQNEKDKFVHPSDCSKYYTCYKCTKPKGWCYEEQKCPAAQTYDDTRKTCVAARCPQLDAIIPASWKCNSHGEVNVVPTDCSKHFTCLSCKDGPWCYKKEESCPGGHTFDNSAKKCVSGRCPQYPPILPNGWACKAVGEQHVHPADCATIYTCITCPDSKAWCYTISKCGNGQTYDDKAKACVNQARCPQLPPLLPDGWKCNQEGEKHVHPQNCGRFYICKRFENSWSFTEQGCPSGQYFNENTKACLVSTYCPQEMVARCQVEAWKMWIPGKCNMYFQCWYVTRGGVSFWEYTEYTCKSGYTFDEYSQKCVKGGCRLYHEYNPTPRPQSTQRPPLPVTWPCASDGEKRVNPENCSRFYTCVKLKNGWSYKEEGCPAGQYFYEETKSCWALPRCPQDPIELPKGWKCNRNGGKKRHPEDCKQYYTCIWVPKPADNKPPYWSYSAGTCGAREYFSEGTETCQSGSCWQ